MHQWGDSWFQKNGHDFSIAIMKLEERVRKWSKAGICGKEKWGTYRDEYLTLWDGGLFRIFFGHKLCFNGRFEKFIYKIDNSLIPWKKTKFGWYKVGLVNFNWKIGLTRLVQKWQLRKINKAFQITCKEYPQFIDELIVDVDCWEYIKPCRWGDVDGTKIHNKYWKTI